MTLDLTTFSESDAGNYLSRTSSTETIASLPGNVAAYAYYDFGAAYFAGNAYAEGQFNVTSNSGATVKTLVFGFSDTLGAFQSNVNSAMAVLQPGSGTNIAPTVYCDLVTASVETDATSITGLAVNTTYYYRVGFFSSLGHYGAHIVQLYSDSGRTTLVAQRILLRTANSTYRYFYSAQSSNGALAGVISATHSNITLYYPSVGANLTGFTKVDPNSRANIYADCASVAGLVNNEAAYDYLDFGAGAYPGNYTIKGVLNVTALSAVASVCQYLSLTNTIDDGSGTSDYHTVYLYALNTTTYQLYARERSSSTVYNSSASSTLNINQPYWVQINRDTSVGTYGTLYVKIFSDPAYSIQVGSTLSVTLHNNGSPSVASFRYLYSYQSINSGATTTKSFTIGGITTSFKNSGTIAFTEDNDTIAISGSCKNSGTIAFTEDSDTIAVSAVTASSGTIAFTEDDDVIAIHGTKNSPVGNVIYTEDDDTIAIAASMKFIGSGAFTEDNDAVAIAGWIPTSATIQWTEDNDIVVVQGHSLSTTEPFDVKVRHKTTGAPITGLTTVLLTAITPLTGLRFDFSNNTWTASPVTPTQALTEVSAANQPGLYRSILTTTNWSGWIETEATYNDGSYIYSYQGEAFYVNGLRENGSFAGSDLSLVNSIKADTGAILPDVSGLPASISSVKSDTGTILADVTSLLASVSGIPSSVWTYIIEGTLTAEQVQRLLLSVLACKVSGAGTGTEIFRDHADSKPRLTFTVDAKGNRTGVVLDAT